MIFLAMVTIMVAQVVGGESDIADMAAIRRGGVGSSSREAPPANASKTLVSNFEIAATWKKSRRRQVSMK